MYLREIVQLGFVAISLRFGSKQVRYANRFNFGAIVEVAAISLGSVFMGAMTYIGNGPNFMVRAIAESSGIKMPSFFGYMVYSFLILLPILALTVWLFLM